MTGGGPVLQMVLRLAESLRASGVDVATVEVLDAANALRYLDLADRPLLQPCLRAAMIKRRDDLDTFDRLFRLCFPLTPAHRTADGDATGAGAEVADAVASAAIPESGHGGPGASGAGDPGEGATELMAALLVALRSGDEESLRALAGRAIDRYAGMASTTGGERYYLYRVMRALDLSGLLVSAMRDIRAEGPDLDPLAMRSRRDNLSAGLERLRRLIADEIHQRLYGQLGISTGTGLVAPRRLEDLDVLQASVTELRALRQAVRPLARKLAARVSTRRRRRRRGRLDVRRTVRRSLQFGGVPLEPIYKTAGPSKPSVVVLSDISGSVAEFAHFTLTLLNALQTELAGLRSFIFVDGVTEVTELLRRAGTALDPRLLVTLPGVVVDDGHSNFASAFRRFIDQYGAAITPVTTLIMTGDARTNYRSPGVDEFDQLCRQARRVYWLNPEPEQQWLETDSALRLFAERCDGVFEVRTLNQLAAAIEQII